jgi:hypothetical protein
MCSGHRVWRATWSGVHAFSLVGGSAAQQSRACSRTNHCVTTIGGGNLRFSAQPVAQADSRHAGVCRLAVR